MMSDAPAIARALRRSLDSLDWMPKLHAPDEDLAFIRDRVLPQQSVNVAEAGGQIVGFAAAHAGWLNLLYLDPEWTGRGIGGRLLETVADASGLKLYCFQANVAACRFYERHGFRASAFSSGSGNEEGLPDVLYVRSARIK